MFKLSVSFNMYTDIGTQVEDAIIMVIENIRALNLL